MNEKRNPLGLLILGGINCFILGIPSFIFCLSLHLGFFPAKGQMLFEELKKKYLPEVTISLAQFKIAIILQMIVASIFTISGLGLLLGKEWARKITLYFAFVIVILTLLVVLFNNTLIKQAIIQIIYPGILIFYLTNKKIEHYFSSGKKRPRPDYKL